jgi:hypothetical protein
MKQQFIKFKKIKSRLTKNLVTELFGEVIKGEKIHPPKIKTVYPSGQGPDRDTSFETINTWMIDIGASCRYNNSFFNLD